MPEVKLQPLPPEEAINYFKSKGLKGSWNWQDMWHEDHVKAFTVAKAMRTDILADIYNEVDRALSKGMTLQDFKKNLTPTLQAKGWWGKKLVGDETGAQVVQLGSPRRLKTIFNVNIQTAYQVGHYRDMTDPDVLAARPYWRYVAVNDSRTRPQHRMWHNTILPADDPWWDTHYPPNGWNCRCTVVSMSKSEMERDEYKVGKSPKVKTYEWIDKTTGEIIDVPEGIDPGWAYNPGKQRVIWDKSPNPMSPAPGQRTFTSFGRPDLRTVPPLYRTPAPQILSKGRDLDEASNIVAKAVGVPEGKDWIDIDTFDGDKAILHRERIPHLVEKRDEARERYAHYIIPTLREPYEIWLTEYKTPDGISFFRKQYIGLFAGKENLFAVINLNRDGSLLWNIMQAGDKSMNKKREGYLLYGK